MLVNAKTNSSFWCSNPNPCPTPPKSPTEEKVCNLANGWFDLNQPPQHDCHKLGCFHPEKPKRVMVCPPLGMNPQCFNSWREIVKQINSNQS